MNGEGGRESGYPEPELRAQRPWSRRAQAVAAVLWPSFLAAAFATMLFFAFVDPADMEHAIRMPMEHTRMTGYGLGFFFFWLVTLLSSGVSVYLLFTRRRRNGNNNQGQG